MIIREFALVVNGDAVAVMHVNEDYASSEGLIAGLLSDPKVVEVTDKNVKGFYILDLDPCKGLADGK